MVAQWGFAADVRVGLLSREPTSWPVLWPTAAGEGFGIGACEATAGRAPLGVAMVRASCPAVPGAPACAARSVAFRHDNDGGEMVREERR